MASSDKVRVNVTISSYLKTWFEEQSKKTGIPQSNLMAMALSEYVDQKEAINTMGSLTSIMGNLENLNLVKPK